MVLSGCGVVACGYKWLYQVMLGYGVVTNGSKGLVISGLKLIHLFLVSPQAVCYGLSHDNLKKHV